MEVDYVGVMRLTHACALYIELRRVLAGDRDVILNRISYQPGMVWS